MYNDAAYNTVTYCDVQGRNSSATSSALSGVIYIGSALSATSSGNDYNTISYNNIHGNANGTPAIGICAYGTTPRKAGFNDSCVISNNNIYDFFSASAATAGVKVDVGNTAWTITNNSIYQTASRTYTTANTHRGLWITPNSSATNDSTANNFMITNNTIGGTAVNAGSTPYTMLGGVANVFYGMDLSIGAGTATSVQNNKVTNIALTSTGISTTVGVFAGINVANGNVNVGNLVGNVIGSATTLGAINVISGASGTTHGIRVATGVTVALTGNTISGITASGTTGGTISTNFNGIYVAGGSTINVANNTIGSTTLAGSISLAASSSTTAQTGNGIYVAGGTTTNITNNTIANIANGQTGASTAATVRGIYVTTSTATITGNTIRNLSSAAPATGSGASSSLIGIALSSTSGACNIVSNSISTLATTSTSTSAGINITGLFFSGTSASTSYIIKNNIHSFDAATADTNIVFTGIDFATATAVVANNFIRMGIKPDGTSFTTATVNRGISSNSSSTFNGFFYNSIYIGGTGVGSSTVPKNSYAFIRTAASGTYDMRSNIFVNSRSNAATGGKHYAVYFTTATTGAAPNFNLYYANGTGGVFAYTGSADVAAYTNGWVSGDANSSYGNPNFANATGSSTAVDLHIPNGTASPAESAGTAVAFVQDDYDGQNRSATLPDAGADEFSGTNSNLCTGMPVAGLVRSSVAGACTGVSFNLIDSAATGGPAIGYQWQSSTDSTNWTNLGGATSSSYIATQNGPTYYRIVVTCLNTNMSANSAGVLVSAPVTPYAVYNGTLYTESFENWLSSCSTTELPGVSWKVNPFTGNNSWRRNDQQASAAWVNPTLGTYTPSSTVGTYSARFHSYQATTGTQGIMDFYVNMSAAAGSTNIKFDYINTSGTDSLSVLISTNGGTTFTRLDSVGVRAAWSTKTIFTNATSATTVIRFVATSDFGVTDIGMDNLQLVNFSSCTGTPTAGTVFSSVSPACSGVNFTLSDTTVSQLSGVTYQWQSSSDSTNWSPITGATATSYTTSITIPTYYRLVVTCTNSGAVAYTAGLRINIFVPTYAVYNGTLYTESFENWVSTCTTTDLPSINWKTVPSSGDNSWRRNDQGANANWTSPTSGVYSPVSTVGSYSARFHTYYAPVGTQGTMDFYVNMSAAAGSSTNLKFDYINTTGSDSLAVLISTNGGSTFTRLDSVGNRTTWSTKTINITSASATTVIRLQGYATVQFGTDVGVDNFQLVNYPACTGTPTAGVVYSSANPVCSGVSFTIADTTVSQASGIAYQWQSSTDNTTWMNITAATSTSYTTSQTVVTYYRLVTTCSSSSTTAMTPAYQINLNAPANCYCTPTYTFGGTNDYVTSVRLLNLTQATAANTSPYYINYTTTQSVIPNLRRGIADTVFLSFGNDGSQFSGIWIDFNQDGAFATTEYFSRARNAGLGGSDSILIVVPSTATLGQTRMRVRGGEDVVLTSAQACAASSSGYGQAQDYFVNITNGTVPITLLSFTGEHKNTVNTLTWTTTSEQNNRGFELQRSVDGKNFSAITFVASKAANGNSNTNLTYSFADTKTLAGNNYYRLKQIDNDGKVSYSPVVLLKGDKANTLTLTMVYPNPAKDKLNVVIASPKADQLTLIVSDVAGKIVRHQKVNAVVGDNNFEVNVQSLTSGNYIIKAICNDGCETVISRFIKQ